jgi:hypothetical protein
MAGVAHPVKRPGARPVAPGVQEPGPLAERVGFEPTNSFESALFKSAAINRSATSPVANDSSARPDGPYEVRSEDALMTTVPPSRSCQPRLRLSMKIQMKPM